MCEAGGKGNMIKWHYHRSAAQGQQSDSFAAEVKQGRQTPNSSSCTIVSSAPAKEESVFGFIEDNKPDNGTNVSYPSFNTQKQLAGSSFRRSPLFKYAYSRLLPCKFAERKFALQTIQFGSLEVLTNLPLYSHVVLGVAQVVAIGIHLLS